MQIATAETIPSIDTGVATTQSIIKNNGAPGPLLRALIKRAIKCNILWLAVIRLRHPRRIWKTYLHMVRSSDIKKIYKVCGRYYYNIYTPAWPSKAYNKFIKRELSAEKPSFIFLAITCKSPMRCEHSFEWNDLNEQESLTREELLQTVKLYQQQGIPQIHFSGGEPMVRIKNLLEIIEYTSRKSECWVFTSGFNMTIQNARMLKQAGCSGVVISIDHYIAERHNQLRGHAFSFEMAVIGVEMAQRAGLVTALSICPTSQFIEQGSLLPYLEFARELGVQFVQVLEPVQVSITHHQQLAGIIKKINHAPEYSSYPALLYHHPICPV